MSPPTEPPSTPPGSTSSRHRRHSACQLATNQCAQYRNVLLLVCETLEELQNNICDVANDLLADTLPLDCFKELDSGHQLLFREINTLCSNLAGVYDAFHEHIRVAQIEAKAEADQMEKALEGLRRRSTNLHKDVRDKRSAFKTKYGEHKQFIQSREGSCSEFSESSRSHPPDFLVGMLYRQFRTALSYQESGNEEILGEFGAIEDIINERVISVLQMLRLFFQDLHIQHAEVYTSLTSAFISRLDADSAMESFIVHQCSLSLKKDESIDYAKHLNTDQFELARNHFDMGCDYMSKSTEFVVNHLAAMSRFWESIPMSLSRLDHAFLEAVMAGETSIPMIENAIEFHNLLDSHAKAFSKSGRYCAKTLSALRDKWIELVTRSKQYVLNNTSMKDKIRESKLKLSMAGAQMAKAEDQWKSCCGDLDQAASAMSALLNQEISGNEVDTKSMIAEKTLLHERVIQSAQDRAIRSAIVSELESEVVTLVEARYKNIRQQLSCIQVREHDRITFMKLSFKELFAELHSFHQKIANDRRPSRASATDSLATSLVSSSSGRRGRRSASCRRWSSPSATHSAATRSCSSTPASPGWSSLPEPVSSSPERQ